MPRALQQLFSKIRGHHQRVEHSRDRAFTVQISGTLDRPFVATEPTQLHPLAVNVSIKSEPFKCADAALTLR
jgi:hypothetical protein